MQVSSHVHAMRFPFQLEVAPGKIVERFAYAYLVMGGKICLIDSGVAGAVDVILGQVRAAGREPHEVALLVLTHAHPDHVGGALGVQRATGCKVAAHSDDLPWIEDVDLQYRERPVPSFHVIVEGSVRVDVRLEDCGRLEVGDGQVLQAIHTPGHSRGHVALWHEGDRALFSGDAIPMPGAVPIYDDVLASVRSLRRLMAIQGADLLLSSWDEPRYGDEIGIIMRQGLEYIQQVHCLVLAHSARHDSSDARALAGYVLDDLGLPPVLMSALFVRSIDAHMQAREQPDLLQE